MAYDTPWLGRRTSHCTMYLQAGQFTSTIITSYESNSLAYPGGITWDGTNTPWSRATNGKLMLQSGQFTSTLKTSYSPLANPDGISWDDTNTPWSSKGSYRLYLQSGQFTSTLKTSRNLGGQAGPTGISWDGTNTPWSDHIGTSKLYLQSGQFTSTIKTSQSIDSIDNDIVDISWDGVNTPWIGNQANKLYLQSGQFSSTLKTSEDISSVSSGEVGGICTNNIDGRLGPPSAPTGVSASSLGTTITISWSPVDGATSYNIYWSNSPGVTKSDTKITDVTSSYIHIVPYGKSYYYVLTAENIIGESDESNEVDAAPYMLEGITDVNCSLMVVIDGTNALLIGTSDSSTSGEVYKLESNTWVNTGTLEGATTVDKLMQAENGWIYAVTNPNGMVFRTWDGITWIKCNTNIGYEGVIETNAIIQVID